MATGALISKPRMAFNFRRKGTTLLLSLNFNKLVADIALFHTQFPRNPFAPDSLAQMGPTQVQKLVFEKHKLGFDNLDHALSLFHRMVQIRSGLSVIDFNQLISAIAKMKQYSTVISLFREFRELDIPIDECTLNILINCFCRINRVDFGFAILGIFFKCGYKADVDAFNTLINGYILQDNTVDAVELFLRLTKDGDVMPDEVTYGAIINGLCKLGNTTMAIEMVRSMQKWNFKPNVVIYSTIIDNLCKDGNIDDALSLFSEMREWDVMPDVVTYNSLVDRLCRTGRWMDATRMLRDMIEQNIFANVVTYNILVDAFCKEGKTNEARGVLAIMFRGGEEPNVVTYSSLMDGYCLQGHMDKAKEVFNSLVDKGLEPDIYSYSILVNGYCKRRNVDEAMYLFREMACKGLKPNIVTLNTLLHGLFKLGRCDAANSFFHEMITRGLNPDVVTYSILLDSFFKNKEIVKAIKVFHSMQDQAKGLKPDVKTYSTIIGGLCEEALLDEAEELLFQMERDGCPPNDLTYNVVVRAFLKRGDKPKVRMLLQEMLDRNFLADASTTAMLVGDCDYLEIIQNLVPRDRKTMS